MEDAAAADLRDVPLNPGEDWHAVKKEEPAEGQPGENPDGENTENPAGDVPAGEEALPEGGENPVAGISRNPSAAAAPSQTGSALIRYTYEGQEVGHAAILLSQSYFKKQEAEEEVEWKPADTTAQKKEENRQEPQKKIRMPLILAAAVGAGAVLALCIGIGVNRMRRKRERKRRSRKNEK